MIDPAYLESTFRETFGKRPTVWAQAPGRVNLIGEHTDYNDGFVFPIAIDRNVHYAALPNDTGSVQLYSVNFEQTTQFHIDKFEHSEDEPWSNYVRGVLWALREEDYPLRGFTGALAGDVPPGAGLSSSAALEVATAELMCAVAGYEIDPRKKARICQRAENEFVGANCGIMDQLISVGGERDMAQLIDCRSLEWKSYRLPTDVAVVVCDTLKGRDLVTSEYNTRREQCEEAARILGVQALRDVSVKEFEARAGELPEIVRKRAAHVVYENRRAQTAAEALRWGDLDVFGQLLDESHESLRDLFEVSCRELDVIVDLAQSQPGCYGARMTGGGFGGCAVSIVKHDAIQGFQERVSAGYEAEIGYRPRIYVCRAADGSSSGPIIKTGPLNAGKKA
jgi:galactokinase